MMICTGGVVRGIENHGVRHLPEKAMRRFADVHGKKSFWDARFVTVSLDISPQGLEEVSRMLQSEDALLRHYNIRVKTTASDYIEARNYKNPYMKKLQT